MKSQRVQRLVERYKLEIKKLDSRSERLTASEKKRYEKLKERFIAQILSWQKAAEREFTQLESNLESSYNELESVWYTTQRR